MEIKEFIEKKLNELKPTDKKVVDFKSQKDLIDYIYKALLNKKFRKFSIGQETKDKIRKAVELNVVKNEPIKIAIAFGCYKLWKFEECPEPDWAELFYMMYCAKWLMPIAEVYKPGVWFDFCGEDVILGLMNNIPEDDIEKYKEIFRNLLKFIKPYLPENFKYTFSPVGERYASREEFLADFNDKLEEIKMKNLAPLTENEKKTIELNIKPIKGEEIDFKKTRLLHDAYMNISKRRSYHKTPEKISVSSTLWGTSIPIGTTKTSVVKFQTGVGILKKNGDSFVEYIYSPSQLESAYFTKENIHIERLEGKNFKMIKVITN